MTARVPLPGVASSLLCLEKQNYMRSRCTNSTQGIKYHHAGIYLLSTELHRGCHTFPRGCRFPGQAAQNPAARNHARTEKLQGSYILVYKLEIVIQKVFNNPVELLSYQSKVKCYLLAYKWQPFTWSLTIPIACI